MMLIVKSDDTELSRSEWISLINEWIFNEEDRKMLERRLLDGVVFEKLAEEFDLSVFQVKKRVYRAQEKLFRHI